MKLVVLAAGAAVALGLAACASTPDSGEREGVYVPPVYRTGSNLPARDGNSVRVLDPEDVDRIRLPSARPPAR